MSFMTGLLKYFVISVLFTCVADLLCVVNFVISLKPFEKSGKPRDAKYDMSGSDMGVTPIDTHVTQSDRVVTHTGFFLLKEK